MLRTSENGIVAPSLYRQHFGRASAWKRARRVIAEAYNGGALITSAAVWQLTQVKRDQILDAANEAYAALRADQVAWADEQAERAVWERLTASAVPAERWSDEDIERID